MNCLKISNSIFLVYCYLIFAFINRRVILDGVNIEVRTGQGAYFVDFVREMRRIMDDYSEDGRYYMLTANPSCVHPSYILDEAFKDAIEAFDHLFVNFDDEQCNVNRKIQFESAFQIWYDYAIRPGGPKIWVGLPSDPRNTRDSQHYLRRVNAKEKLEVRIVNRLFLMMTGIFVVSFLAKLCVSWAARCFKFAKKSLLNSPFPSLYCCYKMNTTVAIR